MRSKACLLACLSLLLVTAGRAQLPTEPATVRIGVFSLFHPQTLALTATHPLTLLLDGSPRILDAHTVATLQATPAGLSVDNAPAQTLSVPTGTFTLAVPGKLSRSYRGALTITARRGILIPIIAMETELAVASIVAAEAPPHAPLEALKAQAVTSRSFLLANTHAHLGFDACDTTHCQFLRSPPPANSPAALATRATRGMVLTWRSSPAAPVGIVAAMFSRSCGGHTRVPSPAQPDRYPFYSVRCDYCLRHPEVWSRTGVPSFATERERIAWNRTHGWASVPSNTHREDNGTLEGRGTGHGVGLCQLGASDLAAHGATFSAILGHYFPNTSLATLR
jgi:stage II sporulation protein D